MASKRSRTRRNVFDAFNCVSDSELEFKGENSDMGADYEHDKDKDSE